MPSHHRGWFLFRCCEAIRTPRRSAKQKEKDDVRKLLDKKPKKARKKKALETAPLGALKTTDKKSELAPIGQATSPEVYKKEPKRTGDHLGGVKKEPTRTGDDDRPPSRTRNKLAAAVSASDSDVS